MVSPSDSIFFILSVSGFERTVGKVDSIFEPSSVILSAIAFSESNVFSNSFIFNFFNGLIFLYISRGCSFILFIVFL